MFPKGLEKGHTIFMDCTSSVPNMKQSCHLMIKCYCKQYRLNNTAGCNTERKNKEINKFAKSDTSVKLLRNRLSLTIYYNLCLQGIVASATFQSLK